MLFSFGQLFFVWLSLFYSSCSPCMKCKVLFIIMGSIIFGLWMLYNKPGSRLWFQRNRRVFQAQSEFWRLTCFLWLFIRDNLIHVKLATGSQCVCMNGQWVACVLEMEEINLKALIHCRPAATFTLTQTDSYLHWSLFLPFFMELRLKHQLLVKMKWITSRAGFWEEKKIYTAARWNHPAWAQTHMWKVRLLSKQQSQSYRGHNTGWFKKNGFI